MMNYELIHNKIIVRAFNRKRIKGVYYEKHHVVPKCLGGTDEDGLVFLTIKEHYIAHHLLTIMYSEYSELQKAYYCMCVSKKLGYNASPKAYEKARVELRNLYSGNGNPQYGKKRPDLAERNRKKIWTKDLRKAISEKAEKRLKNKKRHGMYKKEHTEESKIKMKNSFRIEKHLRGVTGKFISKQ